MIIFRVAGLLIGTVLVIPMLPIVYLHRFLHYIEDKASERKRMHGK